MQKALRQTRVKRRISRKEWLAVSVIGLTLAVALILVARYLLSAQREVSEFSACYNRRDYGCLYDLSDAGTKQQITREQCVRLMAQLMPWLPSTIQGNQLIYDPLPEDESGYYPYSAFQSPDGQRVHAGGLKVPFEKSKEDGQWHQFLTITLSLNLHEMYGDAGTALYKAAWRQHRTPNVPSPNPPENTDEELG